MFLQRKLVFVFLWTSFPRTVWVCYITLRLLCLGFLVKSTLFFLKKRIHILMSERHIKEDISFSLMEELFAQTFLV